MSSYLADRRKELDLTQKQIATAVGVSEATVSRWESGAISNMRRDKIALLARVLRTTPEFIMTGQSSIPAGFEPLPELAPVPLVGRIACGDPITAEENIEDIVSLPAAWRADFALTCHGDSMEPRIHDGDIVAVRKQPMVENGEVAAVRLDSEATLKRVYLYPDHIELRAENPTYPTIVRIGEEMNTVTIEGKAVGLCRGL